MWWLELATVMTVITYILSGKEPPSHPVFSFLNSEQLLAQLGGPTHEIYLRLLANFGRIMKHKLHHLRAAHPVSMATLLWPREYTKYSRRQTTWKLRIFNTRKDSLCLIWCQSTTTCRAGSSVRTPPSSTVYEPSFFHYWLQLWVHRALTLACCRAPLIKCLWNDLLWKYRLLCSGIQRIFSRRSALCNKALRDRLRVLRGKREIEKEGEIAEERSRLEAESALNEANHAAGTCPASGWQAACTAAHPIDMGTSQR